MGRHPRGADAEPLRRLAGCIGPTWLLAVVVVFYLALPLLGLLAVTAASRTSSRNGTTLSALWLPPCCSVSGS